MMLINDSLTNQPLAHSMIPQKGYRTNAGHLPRLENIFGSNSNLSGIPLVGGGGGLASTSNHYLMQHEIDLA